VRAPITLLGRWRTGAAAGPPPGLAGAGSYLTWALVWWRWLACAVAAVVWSVRDSGHGGGRGVVLVGAAVLATAIVTAAGRRGWEAVRSHPALLLPDLLLGAVLISLGGVDTFLLYALAPVLAGAILLPRGLGLGAAPALLVTACVALAAGGVRPPGGPSPGALTWVVAAGAVLACMVLAEAVRTADRAAEDVAREAALRASLERKNLELLQRNLELQAFEEIASTMQTTMDVTEVQERVVVGATDLLGYPRAVLGLCDPNETRMTGWLAATGGRRASGVAHLRGAVGLVRGAGVGGLVGRRGDDVLHRRAEVDHVDPPAVARDEPGEVGGVHVAPVDLHRRGERGRGRPRRAGARGGRRHPRPERRPAGAGRATTPRSRRRIRRRSRSTICTKRTGPEGCPTCGCRSCWGGYAARRRRTARS